MQSQLSIPFPTPAAKPIACRVSLRRIGNATYLGITGPRTGACLQVRRDRLAALPRIVGRIVKAVGHGMVAEFTPGELRSFYAAFRRQQVRYIRR